MLSAASWYRRSHALEHGDADDLLRLLLSKGARAIDAIFPPAGTESLQALAMVVEVPTVDQPLHTVLSLAASGASAEIIGRLVDGGANVHAKTIYVDTNGLFDGAYDVAWNVTPLHIASIFANANALQTLLERRGDGIKYRDMVLCTDNHGRIPLHWAAWGLWFETKATPDGVLHIMDLLLTDDAADLVSSPDAQGDTPLHYVVRSSAGGSAAAEISYRVAKFLCEKGAYVGAHGNNGQTPLHCLVSTYESRPSSNMMALARFLLAHGAEAGDVDADGNTVLHLAARSAQHLETLRFFLIEAAGGHGKSAQDLLHACNAEGDTPLHEAASLRNFALGQSVEERIQSQEAMMGALTPERKSHGGGHGRELLFEQPNQAGKHPSRYARKAELCGGSNRIPNERGPSMAPSLPDSPW